MPGILVRLHTLGPEATESWKAAVFYREKEQKIEKQEASRDKADIEIIGHASFEDILENLADLSGDYLVIPAAFQPRNWAWPGGTCTTFTKSSWV